MGVGVSVTSAVGVAVGIGVGVEKNGGKTKDTEVFVKFATMIINEDKFTHNFCKPFLVIACYFNLMV